MKMHWSSKLRDNAKKYILIKLMVQPFPNAVIIYVNKIKLNTKLHFHAYVSAENIQIR